jgi:tryptophan synthase alpha chain
MVSSSSVTGNQSGFNEIQEHYFQRIASMHLKNPQIVGFGISDKKTFQQATKHQKGAIIGSGFINFIKNNSVEHIQNYINNLL